MPAGSRAHAGRVPGGSAPLFDGPRRARGPGDNKFLVRSLVGRLVLVFFRVRNGR